MKDPFDEFIDNSVYYVSNKYYDRLLKTKRIFFEYLNEKKETTEFKKASQKIWGNVNHKYLHQQIKELEQMIKDRDLTSKKILNSDVKFEEVFKLVKEGKFKEVEKRFKQIIDDYYESRLKIVNKDYIDKNTYLTKLVDIYTDVEKTIPYHNKDGTVRSYHDVASYLSMLYNVNINRAGWNRTLYDSKLLERPILYLPAHTFACHMCREYQGMLYSADGTYGIIDGQIYKPMDIAVDGGVGHPNCRHQFVLYYEKSQIQNNKYNSEQWGENYDLKQKIRGLERERKELKNDKSIFKNLGNNEKVDKISQRIKKINSKIKELNGQIKR